MTDYVECPDCGRALGNGDPFAAVKAHQPHCTATQPRGKIMTAQPLHAVPAQPAAPKRPHPRELVDHSDKRIARAAQKVVDAVDALDEVWRDNAAKAELREKRDKLKRELAKVEAELRGAPKSAAPKRDWKAIRAWAAANGMDCPATGKVPNAFVAAYDAPEGTS
jgi:hypothetical protein